MWLCVAQLRKAGMSEGGFRSLLPAQGWRLRLGRRSVARRVHVGSGDWSVLAPGSACGLRAAVGWGGAGEEAG